MTRILKTISENQYEMSEGMLYPALKRLERKEYIEGYWLNTDSGRRKYYKITEEGVKELERKRKSFQLIESLIKKSSEDLLWNLSLRTLLVRLLVRLIARDEWMMKGKTIDESEDLAIKSFGDSGLIGSQIQQAMFPYRKEQMANTLIFKPTMTKTLKQLRISLMAAQVFSRWSLIVRQIQN